jgi:CheY-like chemotaxis protein
MYGYLSGADAIAPAIANREVVFFVGAGLSATAGVPTWTHLVEAFRSELTPSTQERDPILLAQYYRNQHGDHKLYTLLRQSLSRANVRPARSHQLLCSLPTRVLVTTNYDRLLEATLEKLGRRVHVICDERELGLWDEFSEVQLLKVHGDLNSTAGIVLTDEDYVRFLTDHRGIQLKLLEIFSYRTVVFVGYSMKDRTINHVYDKLLYELGRLKRPAYITTFESDPHMIEHWQRRGMNPVHLAFSGESPVDSGGAADPNDGTAASRTAATERFLEALCARVKARMQQRCDVLVVDDDPDATETLAAFIGTKFPDLRVERVHSGMEGMLAIGKLRPRVVLVDIGMPGMDGLQLIEHVRRYPDMQDIALVCVTGRTRAEDRQKALALGAVDFITKPVDMKLLAERLPRYFRAAGDYTSLLPSLRGTSAGDAPTGEWRIPPDLRPPDPIPL